MRPVTTSESVDDYLKAILELGGAEDSRVSTNALAERLGVRTPSVTGMLQKLAVERPGPLRKAPRRPAYAPPANARVGTDPASSAARIVSARRPEVLLGRGARRSRTAGALHFRAIRRSRSRDPGRSGNRSAWSRNPAEARNRRLSERDALLRWPSDEPAVISSVSDRGAGRAARTGAAGAGARGYTLRGAKPCRRSALGAGGRPRRSHSSPPGTGGAGSGASG